MVVPFVISFGPFRCTIDTTNAARNFGLGPRVAGALSYIRLALKIYSQERDLSRSAVPLAADRPGESARKFHLYPFKNTKHSTLEYLPAFEAFLTNTA
jgi:hypothetical protein